MNDLNLTDDGALQGAPPDSFPGPQPPTPGPMPGGNQPMPPQLAGATAPQGPPPGAAPQAQAQDPMAMIVQRLEEINQRRKQRQQLLQDAMKPDALAAYLPKATASGLLQDALFNIAQQNLHNPRYGGSGTAVVPIQQQRMQQAMDMHGQRLQALTQAEKSDADESGTLSGVMNQMRQMAHDQEMVRTRDDANQTRLKLGMEGIYNRSAIATLTNTRLMTAMKNKFKTIDTLSGADLAQQGIQKDSNGMPIASVPDKFYKVLQNEAGDPREIVPETIWQLLPRVSTTSAEHPVQEMGPDGKPITVKETFNTTNKSQRIVPGMAAAQSGATAAPKTAPPSISAPLPAPKPVNPLVGAASAASPVTPGQPINKPPQAFSPSGGKVLGYTAAEAKREQDAKEYTTEGAKEQAMNQHVGAQIDDVLDKLAPYRTDNTRGLLAKAYLKYRTGKAVGLSDGQDNPDGQLANSISELSLAKLQAASPFMGKSRNYQYMKDVFQHTPNPAIDSGTNMWNKLVEIRRNFLRFEAGVQQDEMKHAGPGSAAPKLSPENASRYVVLANGNKSVAKTMAQKDGWDTSK